MLMKFNSTWILSHKIISISAKGELGRAREIQGEHIVLVDSRLQHQLPNTSRRTIYLTHRSDR